MPSNTPPRRGGKIVWLPTFTAENHLEWEKSSNWSHPAATQKMRHATAVPLFEDGKLRPQGAGCA
jgi:hypothetical protein